MEGCLWRYTGKDIKNTIIILIYRKLNSSEATIILHIQINCSTHGDKIILKYWKSCKSWPLTLPEMHYVKVIFPGF